MFRWTPRPYRGRIDSMFSTRRIPELTERPRSAHAKYFSISMLVTGAYLCLSLGRLAQTPDSRAPDTNQSWTTTTESQRQDGTLHLQSRCQRQTPGRATRNLRNQKNQPRRRRDENYRDAAQHQWWDDACHPDRRAPATQRQ